MFWIWDALLFVIPAYVANSIPVVLGGGPPLDGGRKWRDGRPLLGAGKTVRGAVAAILAATIIGGIFQLYPLGGALSSQMTVFIGFLMGAGTVLGDTVGSFLKRRMSIERGATLPIIDQDGFILVALVLVHTFIAVPLLYWILILAVTPFVHVVFNVIAYVAKWKDVPY